MDLAFFESALPVTHDIINIVIASGWALLLGNLIFQASKSMMSGLGFEADDPRELFMRTFVFAFFLLASRQICTIGLGLSSTLIELLMVPDAVNVAVMDENAFGISASWLLVIIFSFVILWQIIKLFLEVGERYFLVGLLTILAPWAFAMGGSKSTADIFKGWVRMFASMCLMMVLNVVILKLMLSAISSLPSGGDSVPWMIFIVAIARVGRKIDNVVLRIGLNPALTGDGMGRGLPGMLSYMVIRSATSKVLNKAGGAKSATTNNGGTNNSTAHNTTSASSTASTTRASTTRNNSQGSSTSQQKTNYSSRNNQEGVSISSPNSAKSKYDTSVNTSTNGNQTASVSSRNNASQYSVHSPSSGVQANTSGTVTNGNRNTNSTNRTSNHVTEGRSNVEVNSTGTVGTPSSNGISSRFVVPNPVSSSAGVTPQSKSKTPTQSRYTSVPEGVRAPQAGRSKESVPGAARNGSAGSGRSANATSISSRNNDSLQAAVNNSENNTVNYERSGTQGSAGTAQPKSPPPVSPTTTVSNASATSILRENAGAQNRETSRPSQKPITGSAGMPPSGSARQQPSMPNTSVSGNAGNVQHNTSRPATPTQQTSSEQHTRPTAQPDPRQRGNTTQPAAPHRPSNNNITQSPATRENAARSRITSRPSQRPTTGSAGTVPNVTANAAKTANSYKPRQVKTNKSGSTKQRAKNVTSKGKKSKFRRGGKDNGE